MCKVYNSLGSLMTIKAHLRGHNVDEFKIYQGVDELSEELSCYPTTNHFDHSLLIEREKKTLNEEIAQLNELIALRKAAVQRQLEFELEDLSRQFGDFTFNTYQCFYRVLLLFEKEGCSKENSNASIQFQFQD